MCRLISFLLFDHCSLPSATLGLFPRTALSLIFVLTYQSIADELYATHDKSVDSAALRTAHAEVCGRILSDVKAAGFQDLLVTIADQANLQHSPMVRLRTLLLRSQMLLTSS